MLSLSLLQQQDSGCTFAALLLRSAAGRGCHRCGLLGAPFQPPTPWGKPAAAPLLCNGWGWELGVGCGWERVTNVRACVSSPRPLPRLFSNVIWVPSAVPAEERGASGSALLRTPVYHPDGARADRWIAPRAPRRPAAAICATHCWGACGLAERPRPNRAQRGRPTWRGAVTPRGCLKCGGEWKLPSSRPSCVGALLRPLCSGPLCWHTRRLNRRSTSLHTTTTLPKPPIRS